MSNSLTSGLSVATAVGSRITLGGKEYTLAQLTLADLAELEQWVFSKLPDPIQVARELAEGLPTDLAKEILLAAYEDVKAGARKLGTPEAIGLLRTQSGMVQMLYLHGRKNQPWMTIEDWEAVLLAAVEEDMATLGERLTEQGGGAVPDPKAPSSLATMDAPATGANSSAGSAAAANGPPPT